jgi:hypothetical protein
VAAAVLTSRDAEVRLNGIAVAKCRDIQLQLSADLPEDTALGQDSRTYVYGLRSYSGSATLLYDRSSPVSLVLQRALQADDTTSTLDLILLDRSISGTVLFSSVGVGVSVGDIVQVPVQMTFNEIDGTV